MENDIKNRLDEQDDILKNIYQSVEKTRKYFLWTLIITFITLVLPLIALIFIVPKFLNSYISVLGGF